MLKKLVLFAVVLCLTVGVSLAQAAPDPSLGRAQQVELEGVMVWRA